MKTELSQTEIKTEQLHIISKISDSEWKNIDEDAIKTVRWWWRKTKQSVLKSNIKN